MENRQTNQELKLEVEELRTRADLEGQLRQAKREMWRVNNSGLVNAWSHAKREGKELFSMFKDFFFYINEREVKQMETDNAQQLLDDAMDLSAIEIFYPAKEKDDGVTGCNLDLAPAELRI